jgi:hypothetical protein
MTKTVDFMLKRVYNFLACARRPLSPLSEAEGGKSEHMPSRAAR